MRQTRAKTLAKLRRDGGRATLGPPLGKRGITRAYLQELNRWARRQVRCGVMGGIRELHNADPRLSAIAVADLHGNEIVVGNGQNVVASGQSMMKPVLYAFALMQGLPPEILSQIEATAVPFDADKVLAPELQVRRAGHPLNNAGAISSSGALRRKWKKFLKFVRDLARNENIDVLNDVFESEMGTNANNMAMGYRMAVPQEDGTPARFASKQEAEDAVCDYTRACAIGLTVADAMRIALVFANYGKDPVSGKRLIPKNVVVRVINAMNSFGMYEKTGFVTLVASGARALSCKSGIGGIIINVDPHRGAFATYSPLLDSAGNSVFGVYALIVLNARLAAPGAMRLDAEETLRTLEAGYDDEVARIHEKAMKMRAAGVRPRAFKFDKRVLRRQKAACLARIGVYNEVLGAAAA